MKFYLNFCQFLFLFYYFILLFLWRMNLEFNVQYSEQSMISGFWTTTRLHCINNKMILELNWKNWLSVILTSHFHLVLKRMMNNKNDNTLTSFVFVFINNRNINMRPSLFPLVQRLNVSFIHSFILFYFHYTYPNKILLAPWT